MSQLRMESSPHPDAPTVAETAHQGAPATGGEAPDPVIGTHIGRYKLLQKIGEGGWGVVYMAEQEDPVRRRLALKIIKLGMDTRNVIARFEAERQALAMMDHPNIARVLDAGATDTGRPFFVMDLVRGISVTAYCDQHSLPMADRLRLFIQICQAIQHAHQKGIIHRDLKPSNILVSHHDGRPVPKIIDFGIAKASQVRLTDMTLFTAFEQFIGTPAYMSPEQAEMSSLDIDTRSDIYSLGVLLYELLTGRTPFASVDLAEAGLEGMRRILREREPSRPSTRLEELSEPDVTSAAKRRQVEPTRLAGLIRGDLDWIVMKAIDKDRARRYATANELAADVERFLKGEAIAARPPSQIYKMRKLVRRHRLAVAAALAVVTALGAGLAVAVWQYREKKEAWMVTLGTEQEKSRLLGEAQRARSSEEALRREAERQGREARQRTYAADINLAQQALAVNNLGRAQELLAQHRPAAGGAEDLRGWEWRHLWQQCQSEALYTLGQETDGVRSLSVSGDGHWVAVETGMGGPISIWDLRGRRLATRLNPSESNEENSSAAPASENRPPRPPGGGAGRRPFGLMESRAVFSPVGDTLAFARSVRTGDRRESYSVVLWRASDSSVIREVPVDAAAVSFTFSKDGQSLVVLTADNLITRHDVASGTALSLGKVSTSGWMVPLVRTSPDLQSIALAESGGRLRLIDAATGDDRWSVETPDQWVRALAFSPDGSILAGATGTAGEATVRLWKTSGGGELGQLKGHRGQVSGLVFWPDGQTLATASEDHTIRLWDVAGQRALGILRGHRARVRCLALLPDGATLLSAGADGSLLAWDTGMVRRERSQFSLPQAVTAWRFAPDSGSVITLNPEGRISRWHGRHFEAEEVIVETGDGRGRSGPGEGLRMASAQFSSDAQLLAVGSRSGKIVVWDVTARTRRSEINPDDGKLGLLGFVPGTTDVLTVQEGPEKKYVRWNALTGEQVTSWTGSSARGPQPAPGFSPDGRWMVTADDEGQSRWRDLVAGTEEAMGLNLKEAQQAAFSPDAGHLVVVSRAGAAGLWDTHDRRPAGVLRGFLGGMYAAAFSPDSRRLAIGSSDEEAVKLFDIASQRELITLEAAGAQFTLQFSPDGNILAAGNTQGSLTFWRAPAAEATEASSPAE